MNIDMSIEKTARLHGHLKNKSGKFLLRASGIPSQEELLNKAFRNKYQCPPEEQA